MRYSYFLVLFSILLGCRGNQSVQTNERENSLIYEMVSSCLDSMYIIGEFMHEQIYEGGFSGLTYIPNTEYEFFTVTDRGPNTSLKKLLGKDGIMLFPFPDYTQKIIRLRYAENTIQLVSVHPILGSDGDPISGFPANRTFDTNIEIPSIDLAGTKPADKRWKFDLEGISVDTNGDLWLVDEYLPSLLHIDGKTFKIKKRFSAEADTDSFMLPEYFAMRQPNRGFEGVSITPSGKIVAILQSPLNTPELLDSIPNRLVRILHLDPVSGATKTFGYELSADIVDPKIGGMAAINEHEFLIIEHGKNSSGKVANIFKIDLEYATNIDEIYFNASTSFEGLKNNAKAQYYGIILAQKSHFFDLIQAGFNSDFGKPEGIAVIDSSTFSVVNDNDFGIDKVDKKGKLIMNSQPSCIYIFKFNQPVFNVVK